MLRFFALPFTDAFTALERGVGRHGAPALVAIAAACLAGWWVYVPIHLTIAIGMPIVIYVARAPVVSAGALLLFGAALPIAWAPLLSVTGDFYELGSILTSRIAHSLLGVDGTSWRGDDLVKIARPIIDSAQPRGADVAGVVFSFVLGVLLAFATCGVGRMLAVVTDIRAGKTRSRPR